MRVRPVFVGSETKMRTSKFKELSPKPMKNTFGSGWSSTIGCERQTSSIVRCASVVSEP